MKSLDKEAVTITPMHMGDLDEVLWVEQSSFRDPWTRALFEEEFKNPDLSHFLVARCDEHVVGYMGFWLIQDEAHITNLAVHPGFRRRKIGERLVRAILHMACSLDARRATLEVRAGNEPAKRLYEKHGFQLVAIRRKYYVDNNEDALVLWNQDISAFRDSRKKKENTETP
ncbi:ribosomal protein S18-alanine N-acetyltransferase [bacterium]|nr:ribosomal protein S18-alanine N-acetyltransferase [bacterium]